ncbi:MAG: hypothetical protein HFE67_07215 [Erysipelotrichaceae bacterium]|nr:hypothetical protein [Erysipelotrichaceae bacterium]
MKKFLCIFLCILTVLTIAVPILYKNREQVMRAAERQDDEEFVIDAIGAGSKSYPISSAYALFAFTKEGNIFLRDTTINGSGIWEVITDHEGKLLNNVVSISPGWFEGDQSIKGGPGYIDYIALRKDGQLYMAGKNNGKFGNGETSDLYYEKPVLVNPQIPNIKSVYNGYKTNYLLTAGGEVFASGDNSHGQFGNGDVTSTNTFTKANIQDVKELAVSFSTINGGAATVFALKNDGTVWAWGAWVYDGINIHNDVLDPIQIYDSTKTNFLSNVVAINGIMLNNYPALSYMTYKDNTLSIWALGKLTNSQSFSYHQYGQKDNLTLNMQDYLAVYPSASGWNTGIGSMSYQIGTELFYNNHYPISIYGYDGTELTSFIKANYQNSGILGIHINKNGELWVSGIREIIKLPLKITGLKKDATAYSKEEKYNDSITLRTQSTTSGTITCQVENLVDHTTSACDSFNQIETGAISKYETNVDIVQDQRIYLKYNVSNTTNSMSDEFIVDLYKGNPKLTGYSTTSTNKIKITDTINLSVPSDQSGWNTYSAIITDSAGTQSNYTGSALSEGKYTLTVKDAYGNTQDYQFEVTDKPSPTAVFTPASTSLVYGGSETKVNGTVGTLALQYPAGEATSNIATIQLSGDDANAFSIDTNGTLKVKDADLTAKTYTLTISGTDGNGMSFSKEISIVVGKADQNNYQITNLSNYPFQANQKITITTSGNDSKENETYTITSGNSVAQINGNQFELLSSGTFTLSATVDGNTNYNAKTVTKQITIAQLPTQNPPIQISSADSMMYGDTYRPAYQGGQGSGAVSWSIDNDNGTGAVLNNGTISVNGVGSFTLTVTKAQDSNVQASSDTKVITVNRRKITVKPSTVTKLVGEAFKGNGVTYNPQPINGDDIGSVIITSKYPNHQAAGRYSDGIQASGLSHANYEFIYEDGVLVINSNSLPNNGSGYYKIEGTKGKNNWYVSDVKITPTGKDGYDEISTDGITFQSQLVNQADGDYALDFYLRNSTSGVVAKAIRIQLKIDQTAPDVPILSMQETNRNAFARLLNALSFGNWMNQGAKVTMTSNDTTSGLDHFEYTETSNGNPVKKTSSTGIVNYQKDTEITIQAKACDKAGNCSVMSADENLMIDLLAPQISGVKDQSTYKHYYLPRFVNITDTGSGLSYSEYTRDGIMAGNIQENIEEKLYDTGTYEIYAIDNAGNEVRIQFEIVPLPDIDDIDGSDESKDIIDQVQDEYEDVKNQLDENERQDYEQWIEDALEKWEEGRKKVVETDDKSAKVEGQGDTSFDPKVELIVDEISEDDVPRLPKKAISVYDVYLQKGNVKVQPDGSIKVYLPYQEESEPIVYQIDEQGQIIELKVKREDPYLTFVTDQLLKYAISNQAQTCPLDGIEINIDINGDGKPDVNIDTDGDCEPDLNIDTDGDGNPDVNIDTDLDGKPDYNIDSDGDGNADINVGPVNDPFDPSVCKIVQGMEYCSDPYKKPYLNIDTDGDGRPDLNLDLDHDMEADLNIDIDGDWIPDLDIDSDGDGKADINIDGDHDGKADANILKLDEWKPDKNVDGVIQYDTMSGLLERLNDNSGNANLNNGANNQIGGALSGANTGDSQKPFFWWMIVIINMIFMLVSYSRVKKEKQRNK